MAAPAAAPRSARKSPRASDPSAADSDAWDACRSFFAWTSSSRASLRLTFAKLRSSPDLSPLRGQRLDLIGHDCLASTVCRATRNTASARRALKYARSTCSSTSARRASTSFCRESATQRRALHQIAGPAEVGQSAARRRRRPRSDRESSGCSGHPPQFASRPGAGAREAAEDRRKVPPIWPGGWSRRRRARPRVQRGSAG